MRHIGIIVCLNALAACSDDGGSCKITFTNAVSLETGVMCELVEERCSGEPARCWSDCLEDGTRASASVPVPCE